MARRNAELARKLEQVGEGPLPYRVANNLPFGQGWNTAANESGLKSFGLQHLSVLWLRRSRVSLQRLELLTSSLYNMSTSRRPVQL